MDFQSEDDAHRNLSHPQLKQHLLTENSCPTLGVAAIDRVSSPLEETALVPRPLSAPLGEPTATTPLHGPDLRDSARKRSMPAFPTSGSRITEGVLQELSRAVVSNYTQLSSQPNQKPYSRPSHWHSLVAVQTQPA